MHDDDAGLRAVLKYARSSTDPRPQHSETQTRGNKAPGRALQRESRTAQTTAQPCRRSGAAPPRTRRAPRSRARRPKRKRPTKRATPGSSRPCTSTAARTSRPLFLIRASTVLEWVGPRPNWRGRWRPGCGLPQRNRSSRTTGRGGSSASRPSSRCLLIKERRSSPLPQNRRGRGSCSLPQGRRHRLLMKRRRRLYQARRRGRSGRCRTASHPRRGSALLWRRRARPSRRRRRRH